MFNWHKKLMDFLSPSITIGSIGAISAFPAYMTKQGQGTATAMPPTVPTGTPRSTAYQINPYTANQLAQFAQQQGLLSEQNPQYQQYLAKMAGYGAGAGKTAPTVTAPTQGNNNG